MNELLDYADCEPDVDSATRPMTQAELRRLASSRLIEIGAHTTSHCSLPDLPPGGPTRRNQGIATAMP